MLVGLSLSSCEVSPKWRAQNMGQNQVAQAPITMPHFRQVTAPVAHPQYQPAPVVQARPAYTQPPATYLTASAVAKSTPVLVKPQRTFVTAPQPLPKVRPQIQPQTKPPAVRGKVRLVNGRAIAPPDAPAVVRRAVEAGNRMQKFPYKWGGGHAVLDDTGYDCSGTVSYVLREAGIMPGQRISRGFLDYGEAGEGDWITVWAKDGHVFMIIGGLRLDTGGSTRRTGPRWKPESRHYKGFIARHPRGL